MLSDISLGRYVDTGSILHRTDPRVKIILYLIYLIAIFMVSSPAALIAMFVIVALQLLVARMPVKVTWNTLKPMIPLVLFITILNLFTLKQGEIIWQWKSLSITDFGVQKAVLMGLRLIFLVLSTSVFLTLTTTPLKISDALESLFGPLKLIKVPVHEMAMMMSIALRFIPTLIDETDKIMKAQVSRGADYDTGSFLNRIKGYITILIPLFVSSFKRAEDLAIAMDARCYRGGIGRTKLNPLKLTKTDVAVGLLFTLGAALLVVIDFLVR